MCIYNVYIERVYRTCNACNIGSTARNVGSTERNVGSTERASLGRIPLPLPTACPDPATLAQ